MAYEYGTQGATLNFPNPYWIENQFLALRGALLLGFAVWLLLLARAAGDSVIAGSGRGLSSQATFLLLLAGGITLAVFALLDLVRMASQLRVFFGRGQPPSLADEVPTGRAGAPASAQALAETLRRGSIALAEPHGPLNGVLYSLAKDLITAPPQLRAIVQDRFANLVTSVGLLLLFTLTFAVVTQPAARALAAAVYLLLGGFLVLRHYVRGQQRTKGLTVTMVVALLVLAVVGTVFLGWLARQVPPAQAATLVRFSLPTVAFALLIASVVVEALGFIAGLRHVDPPPPASTASEQIAVSFNADPNLLLHEIDREMQRRWTEQIPNRRYVWQPPTLDLNAGAGNFSGQVLEETQPMPPQAVRKIDWSTVLAHPRFGWLALVDTLGLLLTAGGAALWLALGQALVAGRTLEGPYGSTGFILLVTGGYAMRVAHALWGRLDFESTLVWIELHGSFARARMDIGNQWTDRVRSERSVVNIESMTLRAWVVEARSVLFDYRDKHVGSRWMLGMVGARGQAQHWVALVREFAQAQSSVVTPGANADAQRIAHMQSLNALAGAAPAPRLMAAAGPDTLPEPTPAQSAAAAATCPACHARVAPGSRFCHQCGQAMRSEV